jgi:hypothetical protein
VDFRCFAVGTSRVQREAFDVAGKIVKPVVGVLAGMALCFGSTVAAAATVPVSAPFAPVSISPFVALSAYGTIQSRDAVCAVAVGASGAAATTEGQTPAQGCVLPVLDPVAPVAVDTAPIAPVAVAPAGGFGLGMGALLAGLVLVAGLAAVLLSGNDDDDVLPISPD